MKLVTKTLIVLLGMVLITTACQQSSKKPTDQDSTLVDQDEIEQGLTEVANPLPEPFEVYDMLESIGASYHAAILNSPDNADMYFTQKSKAANVGVYAADLAYTVTYNKEEDIKTYARTLKTVMDELNVPIDFAKLQSQTMNQPDMSKDTLIAQLGDVYYDTYKFLHKESTPSLSALMAAGAWIEGLYIASNISKDTYQNLEIVKIIYKQGDALPGLIDYMEKFKSDEMVSTLQEALKKLKAVYDAAGESLTKAQLDEITATVKTIRESIVS